MSLTTKLRRTSKRLADKFGATLVLTYVSAPTLDAATGIVTTTETTATVRGIVENYSEFDLLTDPAIEAGDLKVTISAQGITEPAPEDRVTIDSVEYDVIDVTHHESGTTDVMYELQVRRP